MSNGYGAVLIPNSDQDFPRTKYTPPILSPTKKEGNDYASILLCLIVCMVSNRGKRELTTESYIPTKSIDSLIQTWELIIGMEEFFKHGYILKNELENLKKMMVH